MSVKSSTELMLYVVLAMPALNKAYLFIYLFIYYSESVKGNCYLNSRISMIFSLILNLPIKRPSVQKTLHFSAIRLVCSYRSINRQYMAIYVVSTTNGLS